MQNEIVNKSIYIDNIDEIYNYCDVIINIHVFTEYDLELYVKLLDTSLEKGEYELFSGIFIKNLNICLGPILQIRKCTLDKNKKYLNKKIFIFFKYLEGEFHTENLISHFEKILEHVLFRIPDLKVKDGYEKITLEDMKFSKGNILPTHEQTAAINSLVNYKGYYKGTKNEQNELLQLENEEGFSKNGIHRGIEIYIRMAQSQFLGNGNKRSALAFLYVFLLEQKIYFGTEDVFNDPQFVDKFEKLALETASRKEHIGKESEFGNKELCITKNEKTEKKIYDDLFNFILKNAKICI